MRAVILGVIIGCIAGGPADLWAAQQPVSAEVEMKAFKEMAATIPLGSRIKIQTTARKRLSGTLLAITEDAVVVKKDTRVAEPAVTIRFDELTRLERDHPRNGMNVARMAAVGIATGAGAILTLFLLFAAIGD